MGDFPDIYSRHCIAFSTFFFLLFFFVLHLRHTLCLVVCHEVHDPHLVPPRSNNNIQHSTSLLATPQNHQHDHPPTHRQRQHQFLLHQLRHPRHPLTKALLLLVFRILPNQLGRQRLDELSSLLNPRPDRNMVELRFHSRFLRRHECVSIPTVSVFFHWGFFRRCEAGFGQGCECYWL